MGLRVKRTRAMLNVREQDERRTKSISFKERLRLNLLTFLNKYDENEESKAVGVSTEDIHRSFW